MKKIYSLVLLVAGVFSWGSCSLDEVNPNNSGQFSDGSYTLETYKAFTNSCYTALINNIYQSSDYLVCTEAVLIFGKNLNRVPAISVIIVITV